MARIVVIEDDDGVIDLVRTVLERAGHEVTVAGDATAGFAAVEAALDGRSYGSGEPEPAAVDRLVVVTDIFMPDRDGLEVTSQIKRDHPEVGVVAISGGGAGGDRSYLAAAREFGADFTLPKPFRPNELRSAVEEVLRDLAR